MYNSCLCNIRAALRFLRKPSPFLVTFVALYQQKIRLNAIVDVSANREITLKNT